MAGRGTAIGHAPRGPKPFGPVVSPGAGAELACLSMNLIEIPVPDGTAQATADKQITDAVFQWLRETF